MHGHKCSGQSSIMAVGACEPCVLCAQLERATYLDMDKILAGDYNLTYSAHNYVYHDTYCVSGFLQRTVP